MHSLKPVMRERKNILLVTTYEHRLGIYPCNTNIFSINRYIIRFVTFWGTFWRKEAINFYFSPILAINGGQECNKSFMCSFQQDQAFLDANCCLITCLSCPISLNMTKWSSLKKGCIFLSKFFERGIFSSLKGVYFLTQFPLNGDHFCTHKFLYTHKSPK